ncbi:MAG TPA: XRE family transcriptional regulator [Thermoguttaceae bacterium]|nr:XRE family transcriptional regulator [Thermoguttaceae bacterium]
MDSTKRRALEAAGWTVGDASDFLEMSDAERQVLDVRVKLALAVRRQRQASHLSQKALGLRLGTSQPRVAKIERAAADVSLDQLMRAFAAVGGRIVIKSTVGKTRKAASGKKTPRDTLVLEARERR